MMRSMKKQARQYNRVVLRNGKTGKVEEEEVRKKRQYNRRRVLRNDKE